LLKRIKALFIVIYKELKLASMEKFLKKIIITGASKGIGFSLAQRLQGEGFHVIGVARNFSSKAILKN